MSLLSLPAPAVPERGLVPLARITGSSAPFNMEGFFDAAYDRYDILIRAVTTSDTNSFAVRTNQGGGYDSGASDYAFSSDDGASTNAAQAGLVGGWDGGSVGTDQIAKIEILHAGDATMFPRLRVYNHGVSPTNTLARNRYVSYRKAAGKLTGIQLAAVSGGIASAIAEIWAWTKPT